jgi:uncharacterized protein (TIGR02757 family)
MTDLASELDAFLQSFDFARHRENDPIRFVHRYPDPADREVVALFAALMAYGRADLIGRALRDVVARIGDAPAAACATDDEATALARFDGFVYRLTRGPDLARIWLGAGALRRRHGSLAAAFRAGDDPAAPDLRPAVTAFRADLLAPTAHFPARRAFEHFFPDPRRGSPCKRLCMFLRWMVRGPDAIDLGLWSDLGPARLTIPLDTHVHRLARYLGLTARAQSDWRTAAEVTAALRALDPADPLRFDFALAHMGISGQCPTRRVEAICRECPIRGVCRLDAEGRTR